MVRVTAASMQCTVVCVDDPLQSLDPIRPIHPVRRIRTVDLLNRFSNMHCDDDLRKGLDEKIVEMNLSSRE
jgi:hypothetical protein